MAISAFRTVKPSAAVGAYGASFASPVLRFPVAQPGDVLDYSLDLSSLLTDATDFIVSAAYSSEPSGAGEMQANSVTVLDTVVTAWLAGGVPGRTYIGRFDVTTLNGRTFEVLTSIWVSPTLGVNPMPAPPSNGFGTPVTWFWTPGADYTNPLNSMFLPL